MGQYNISVAVSELTNHNATSSFIWNRLLIYATGTESYIWRIYLVLILWESFEMSLSFRWHHQWMRDTCLQSACPCAATRVVTRTGRASSQILTIFYSRSPRATGRRRQLRWNHLLIAYIKHTLTVSYSPFRNQNVPQEILFFIRMLIFYAFT